MPKTAVTSFFDIPTPLQCGKEANGFFLLYCWFVAEVLVTILIYKNKLSFSLRWELNSFFMQFLLKEFCCFVNQSGHLDTWLQTKNVTAP